MEDLKGWEDVMRRIAIATLAVVAVLMVTFALPPGRSADATRRDDRC